MIKLHRPTSVSHETRRDANLSDPDLWLRYFKLGGMRTPVQVESYLRGKIEPSAHDHDLLAHALNERFSELNRSVLVRYAVSTDEAEVIIQGLLPEPNDDEIGTGLSDSALWLRYFELGEQRGLVASAEVESYLRRGGTPGDEDHDVVAQALNERLWELGRGALVEYSDAPPAPTISVVIPTLNEAKNLPFVLGRLPGDVHEVIIVDGNSTDDTIAVAEACRPGVKVVLQKGRGKGNALECGFRAVTGDITVMLDADGSTDPAEIPRFVEVLVAGADVAKGSRFTPGGGSDDMTFVRRLGNRVLTLIVNTIWGVRYTDLCYGYMAFWTRQLPSIYTACNGFEVETLMNIRIAVSDLAVTEVPSFEALRHNGTSNLHAGRDGRRVLRTIVSEVMRPK